MGQDGPKKGQASGRIRLYNALTERISTGLAKGWPNA
jgi:hypothetical protein